MKESAIPSKSDNLNTMTRYHKAKEFVLGFLKTGLPDTLFYHSYDHVMDVLGAAERLAAMEGVSEPDLELLRVAVLLHDSGFTVDPKEHEKTSCDIARKKLPAFGYSGQDIERICGIIMATKYPQSPANLLEEIMCDADLDYLGRDDFFTIGNSLLRELNENGRFKTEQDWNHFQEKFLSSHRYFTASAIRLRNEKKEMHLKKIRQSLQA
jgi:predicted metal-dependent HD superfamily phosphohydrolase